MTTNPPFAVRPAREEDISAIIALINANRGNLLPRTPEELEALLGTTWVATASEVVVGSVILEVYSAKIAELRTLAVDKEWQRHGVGTALVRAVIAEVKRRQIPELLAVTSAVTFFEGLGFGTCLNEKYALFWNGKG